jgi:branched-chain amino acid transport system substrate-binding protein
MKRLLVVLGALAVMALMAGGSVQAEVGVTDDKIVIGVISDLTGPSAIGGIGMADAITSYFKEVNEAGGVHGRQVEVIIEDSAYSPTKTVSAAKKLIAKDNIFALLSPWGTGPATALFPLVEEEKLPIAPACSLATSIYDPFKKYVFAAGTNYVDQSLYIVDYAIKNLGVAKPKVAIFCQDDDWGADHVKGLEIAREKHGLPEIAVETYKYNAIEFKSQVINLMKAAPDVCIVAASLKAGGTFLKEAAKLKWKTNFVGSNTMAFLPTLQLAGEYGDGLLVVGIFANADETDVPGVKKMVAASEKHFGDKWMPAAAKIHPYYLYGWVNAMILHEGLKNAGRELTREGLVKGMESIKDFNPDGLAGPITYSAESHGSPGFCRMLKGDVANTRFVPLTDWTYVER